VKRLQDLKTVDARAKVLERGLYLLARLGVTSARREGSAHASGSGLPMRLRGPWTPTIPKHATSVEVKLQKPATHPRAGHTYKGSRLGQRDRHIVGCERARHAALDSGERGESSVFHSATTLPSTVTRDAQPFGA
jgi:hypothetical protein